VINIKIDTKAFTDACNESLVAMQAATRPAAQAGAQVIYDAAKLNVPVGTKGHYFHGSSFRKNGKKYFFDAGTLKKAIYQVYSKSHSDKNLSTYHVSWNYKKAPYGFMVEMGTTHSAAHSFIEKSVIEQGEAAAQAMTAKFHEVMK
jgi:HK97 gp10 family phage protein